MNTRAINKPTSTTWWSSLMAFVVILMTLIQLTGCGGKGGNDPAPSPQDEAKAKLLAASRWNLQSTLVDGADRSATYAGLTVAFTATSFTATNGRGLWPATGSWSFVGTDGKTIKRDDGTEMAVEVTDTSLKLSFTWTKTTLGSGRLGSIKGQHVLSFTK